MEMKHVVSQLNGRMDDIERNVVLYDEALWKGGISEKDYLNQVQQWIGQCFLAQDILMMIDPSGLEADHAGPLLLIQRLEAYAYRIDNSSPVEDEDDVEDDETEYDENGDPIVDEDNEVVVEFVFTAVAKQYGRPHYIVWNTNPFDAAEQILALMKVNLPLVRDESLTIQLEDGLRGTEWEVEVDDGEYKRMWR